MKSLPKIDKRPRVVTPKYYLFGCNSEINLFWYPLVKRFHFLRHPSQFPSRTKYQLNVVWIAIPAIFLYNFAKGERGLLGGEIRHNKNKKLQAKWSNDNKEKLAAFKSEMINSGEWDSL